MDKWNFELMGVDKQRYPVRDVAYIFGLKI
jgi:hypothetical protein